MVHLPLYDEVIRDYEDLYDFRRRTVTINNIGREERLDYDFKYVCMVRPLGTYDIQHQDPEGSRWEDGVTVFTRLDNRIQLLDLVYFGGYWYKLDKERTGKISDYRKFFATKIKDREA